MEAGLVVGGKVTGSVITRLINGIIDYAKDQKKMQLGLKDELKRLEKALPKIQAVVNAVDQGLIKEENPPLEKWLWQLKDAADQAEDVMDEMEYNFVKERVEAGKDKVSKFVSQFKTFLERAANIDPALVRLKKAVKAIDGVASDVGEFYMLVQDLVKKQNQMVKSVTSNRETSSILKVGTRVFGREKEKEDVINKLLNPKWKTMDTNFAVLPVVGAGGVGKTTLAQLVYNDPEVERYFDLRMWVCISNNFDVVLLTKKLYESSFGQRADFDNFDTIQMKLHEKLMSKRFLVVFDDAWSENELQWENLLAPLSSGKTGSMILLTTRVEAVARSTGRNLMGPIILEGLNEYDMWNLFEACAFGGEGSNCHKELVEIGKDIVKMLKGSPLAAKTVGAILRSNLSEEYWTSTLKSELWSLRKGQHDIMPALRLSYQHLPSHLKPCFSFCSIFAQDHVFVKDDLIYMWLALGLVPRDFDGEKRPEDVGSEYFNDMVSRSIFSPANSVRNAHLHYPAYTYCNLTDKQFVGGYVMHDLMHDLSTFVSQDECFRSHIDKSRSIPPTARHLYIRVDDCCELSNFCLKNVRTLILQFNNSHHPELECYISKTLKGMKNLRVLTLITLNLTEIPECVSNLLHLRYLSISSFMLGAFPQSMSRLHLLETMVCGGFGINRQADVLVRLSNLRHLITSESFAETIADLGRLTSLQELRFRVGKASGFKICELSNMRELQRLSISNINDVANHEEAILANLKSKASLCELSLQWETDDFNENVLHYLEPHYGLKKLRIRNYMGGRPPLWLQTKALSKLVYIGIHDCNWENLPCLEELPFLKYVDFHGMHALKHWIIPGGRTFEVQLFPSLEVLSFESSIIEQWCFTKQPSNWMKCMQELTLNNCPNLGLLPPLPLSLKKLKLKSLGLVALPNLQEDEIARSRSLSSLVSIEISECPNLLSLHIGLLQKPDQLVVLEELTVRDCRILELPVGNFSKFVSLKRLDISGSPKIENLPVHVLVMPPTLQFLRFNRYEKDLQADLRKEISLHELSLQSAPISQTTEVKLVVLNNPGENSIREVRYPGMRDDIGRWPPIWFTQTFSTLESLTIDGSEPFVHNLYCNELQDGMIWLLGIIYPENSIRCEFLSLEKAYPSDMPAIEQIYLAIDHIKWMPCLKKLTVALCSKLCVMPPISVNLKELRLHHLELKVLPFLWEDISSESGSLLSLIRIDISRCKYLESLAKGLFQEPQQFAALEKLTIRDCTRLRHLPEGGFNRFISLRELDISNCYNIHRQAVPELFLPSSLQVLRFDFCGDLDATLMKALESVQSLISLKLFECDNITNLPPKEVFSRWKTLEELEFSYCRELTSLESLLGLSSVKLLIICKCPKLVSAITSPSAWNIDEIEGIVEDSTVQTSVRPASTQPAPTDPNSSTNREKQPLLFVDELQIDNPLLLSIEPIRSLSSVGKLTIGDCSEMQSLPELPLILEKLSLHKCCPELKRRCEEAGEDWSKLSYIPKVSII